MQRISDIKKSKTDKREYRYIELPNGLRCMLLSDDNVELSAASLDVKVGSLYNPKEHFGLAHFCEHMLFLGTKKYPDESSYSKFIKDNGGSTNAYTDLMDTNYYFSVSNSALSEALDRFSQFFKEPLFNEDAVTREINSVDSEHNKNLSNDTWRLNQLIMSLSNPESCSNQFPTGSIETLGKENIRSALIDFHGKYYSANLMTLCIAGKHSLDDLEKLCIEHFSSIENKNVKALDTTLPIAYGKAQLGRFIRVVPIIPKDKLIIMWKFHDTIKNYKTKPSHYLAHILGHEGPNSLLSYLIDEKLALGLVTYVDRREADTAFLTASIELTEEGLKEYERVIEIVAAFVKMLKEKGPRKYLFDELSQMERLSFEFKDQRGSISTASVLAKSLQNYHKDIIQDILEGQNVVTEYNEKAIQELIDLMEPDNMFIILASYSCVNLVNAEEKWYKTKYSCEEFNEEMKKRLYDPKVGPSKNGKLLDLPPENILIPKSVDLLPKLIDPPIFPKKVKITEASTIWYKRDHSFDVPKGYGFCCIQTNDNGFPMTGDSQAFIALYFKIFFEDIREFMYMAEMAGINCKIEIMFDKLTLMFHGFNESLPALVDSFLKKLKEFQPEKSKELFDIKLTEIKNNTTSILKRTLYMLALKNYTIGLTCYGPDQYQYLQLLEQYTFDKFVYMAKNWLKNVRLDWYIAGNLLEENAIDIALTAEKLLVANTLPEDSIIAFKTMAIPNHTEYLLIDKTYNQEEVNSCIISYFQGDPFLDSELKEVAKNHVAINFIKESTFDYLRTKHQLGYVVDVANSNINRVLGARFIIQSDKVCPEKIYQKINDFLKDAWNNIKNMADEGFKVHIEAVCTPLRQKHMNLAEESMVYWKEISKDENLFDRKEKLVEALQSLKRDEVINYFYNLFLGNVKRYDYEIVAAQHWEENLKTIAENEESAKKRGNKRIKVASFEHMREINLIFPNIYLLNKRKPTETYFKVDPDKMSKEYPVKLSNLIDGEWEEGKSYSSITDPLNGDEFIQIPNTEKEELKRFADSLSKVRETDLHNPLTNTYRYTLYGEICKRAHELLSKEAVKAHFVKLIQRVAPKDCYKACGEVRRVKEFLAQFSGDGVFSLVYSQSHPDEGEDQIKVKCRWPLGAVAVITPSSSPLELPAIEMLSALFMGNKVILKPSSKTSLVIEEFLRLLHHCGMPLGDCDLIHCNGKTFESLYEMCDIKITQFIGSKKIAEKLIPCTKEHIHIQTSTTYCKILAPDTSNMNLHILAFECDQNRCTEDFLMVSKNLAETEFYEKLKNLAGNRNLKEFTIAPVLSATNKEYETYRDFVLSLEGSKILFGGKELIEHAIPSCYGAWEPSAYFVPFKHFIDPQVFSKLKQKPFGPIQIITEYENVDELLQVLKQIPLKQAIVVSKDPIFRSRVLERIVSEPAESNAKLAGALQDIWYSQVPTTSDFIKVKWSKNYERPSNAK